MIKSAYKSLFAVGLAACFTCTDASAAIFIFSFSTGANPTAPESPAGGGGATATINPGAFASGYVNPNTGFTSQSGQPSVPLYWDLGQSGNVVLTIPSTAGDPLQLTLTVRQFWNGDNYTGVLSYGVANGIQQSSETFTTYALASPSGQWRDYTTVWDISPSLASETVTFTGPANGALIGGVTITAVPEPASSMALAGALALATSAYLRWARRART